MERRHHTRRRSRISVYLFRKGHHIRLCKAKNLSAAGVFVETHNMGLPPGSVVELAFVVRLGSITRIHRRTAKVCHVSRGGTGLALLQASG
ncbi:MAG: PilZ domain-containing protein [Gammaproteobacteria bacterium]|jgi:hypothetical protein